MAEISRTIEIRGRYFWKGDERFLLKGVVYQSARKNKAAHRHVQDPLEDEYLDELQRSLPLFRRLGLNAIFVYTINHTKNHDAAMKLLADAEVYVLFCLSTPKACIDRSAPLKSYSIELLQHYFSTIDCVAAYSNTLGVIVANEVINAMDSTRAAPVIRAATRDVKRYMALAAEICGQRVLPVGVSSSKILNIFKNEFDYLTGGDQSEGLDFFSFNNYSWCGESSMSISAYDKLVEMFAQAHVPVFFSEYGANVGIPRIFSETRAIYSPEMTGVFSGGFVYEFFEAPNRYGLVKPTEDARVDPLLQDFHNLKSSLDSCRSVPPNTLLQWSDSMFTSTCAPEMPRNTTNWHASTNRPVCPVNWQEVRVRLEDREWVDVEREIQELEIEELAKSMWGRYRVEGTGPRWA